MTEGERYEISLSDPPTPAELKLEGERWGAFMAEQAIGLVKVKADANVPAENDEQADAVISRAIRANWDGTLANLAKIITPKQLAAFERAATRVMRGRIARARRQLFSVRPGDR